MASYKEATLTEAELYGYGVFETLKFADNRIEFFDHHLKRLRSAAAYIAATPPDREQVVKLAKSALTKYNSDTPLRLRLSVNNPAPNTQISLQINDYTYTEKQFKDGFALRSSKNRFYSQSPLRNIKSSNYLPFLLEREEAKKANCNEALLFNEKNYVTEGSFTNLFFRKGKNIYTAHENLGLLPGIIREIIIKSARESSFHLQFAKLSLQDLFTMDEAFCTNSLVHIMPIRLIDSKEFAITERKATEEFSLIIEEKVKQEALWIKKE